MARNRKKAKERRARRPANGNAPRPGAGRAGFDAPDPIQHASPDVELAEAQLALGRPEPEPEADPEPEDTELGAEEELTEAELGQGPELPGVFPQRVRLDAEENGVDVEADEDVELEDEYGETLPARARPAAPSAPRAGAGRRLITFLQGSWRELQRVQWPDRRQVMQATGVVIGFVIVAGVFLGVADFAATKIMNYILTGNFK